MAAVCKELGEYLAGWKAYFRIAETPRVFADADKWVRHRLRALQLKHWKRGPTIYRELRARGMRDHAASRVAGNGRRWWHNSALDLHIALPRPALRRTGGAPARRGDLNLSNRPVRTRMPGGVAGVVESIHAPMPIPRSSSCRLRSVSAAVTLCASGLVLSTISLVRSDFVGISLV